MKIVQQHLPAERLMGVEIVAQQRVIACGVALGVGGQPALGGVDFAILFEFPVLGRDELRTQRHHLRVAWTDDHRSDGAVEMNELAFGVAEAGTMAAVNVLRLGREIPGGVQGDEAGLLNGPHGFEQTGFIKGLVQVIKEAEKAGSFDGVQRLADVVIAGNVLDLEERPSVVAADDLLHVLLETQEGRALGEEDRKSRERDIGHGVEAVLAGTPVRQSGRDSPPPLDKVIEAAPVHAPKGMPVQS